MKSPAIELDRTELEALRAAAQRALAEKCYRTLELLLAVYARLKKERHNLKAENKRLKAENDTLKEALNQNASNSSKPPSSLPADKKKPKPSTPKSNRKRGAQPGHPDQQRRLYPLDQVNRIIVCKPHSCERCGKSLDGEDPEPRRVQKAELPEIKPDVTEFQIHTLGCDCGHETSGQLPADVDARAFGPRVQAIVSLLSGAYRLSKREIEQLMSDLFNVNMSLGSVCNLEHATSGALEVPVEEAKAFIHSQPAVHLDETGWREAKKKAWLWTAVTTWVTVFVVRLSRGAEVVKELLGDAFAGIANSDRWSAYTWIPLNQRQLCWPHLKRNFQKLVDRGGRSAEIGRRLLACHDRLFEYLQRVRDGTLKRSTFLKYMSKLQQEVFVTLLAGAGLRHKKTAKFCENVFALEPALWTFVRVEGVAPTNNAAERAVRKPVLWRKGSFGTDSARGSRFVERILTVVASLRSQKRNVLKYLVEACSAARRGMPAPSLLPDESKTA